MLGKKQSVKSNLDWEQAFESCVDYVSAEDAGRLEENAIAHIKRVCKNYNSVCSGWIAGKDSIVLEHILKKSGIVYMPVMWRGVNEWPAMKEWIERNAPKNIIFETINKFNFAFLEKHPEYLFCQGNTRQKWMAEKWRRYGKDIPRRGFDLFITARRLKDGNVCGSADTDFCVQKNGYVTYAPLAEWTHEELLAYIRRNNIELPPFYSFPRGFLIGSISTGEWTEYACLGKSEEEVWEEIYGIDCNVVIGAAEHLSSARKFLERRNGK